MGLVELLVVLLIGAWLLGTVLRIGGSLISILLILALVFLALRFLGISF